MSGSGDYTLTPYLGLYKPNYALDVGQWGNHLNLNSDKLDAALGGGGTVSAMDFNADPTGVLDSSGAINAAASVVGPNGRRKTVYLPTGTYRVDHPINLTASQGLIGDTRGSSILYVDDKFDPAALSVINVTASSYDAGPVLRDFGITFAQPSGQGLRSNFKTLAEGGTSGVGGTGVKYPWAIAAGSDSFRVQIRNIRIGGAWDGITSNGHNAVFWLDDIEMGALDCGLSLGEGTGGGIQDFTHVDGYHFWNFDLAGSLFNAFNDGQTIGMRVGRVDSLDIGRLSMFCARLVFTPETANFTYCQIANCQLDGDPAGIEVNGPMRQLAIGKLYGSAGTGRVRPFVQVNAACNLQISKYSAVSSSNYPDFVVNDYDADVTLGFFHAIFFPNNIRWAEVQRGVLRLVEGFLLLDGPRTVPPIAETSNGHLIVDDLVVQATTPSGPLISVVTTGEFSMIGRLITQAASTWTVSLPAGLRQVFYSPSTTFKGGLFADGSIQAGTLAGSGVNLGLVSVSGQQKALLYYRGANIAWGAVVSGAADDFGIGRWNDAGVFQGNVMSFSRATGVASMPALLAAVAYVNDAAAAAGGVPVGGIYRNGSVIQIRIT
jgi:hypothetical protein